jgi:hypothetical protein
LGREIDEKGNPITRLITSSVIPAWLVMVKGNPVVRQTRVSGGLELEHEDGQVWFIPDWNVEQVREALPKPNRA